MSTRTKLQNFLSNLPDFIFEYIEMYYTGESINTQIGYSIDLRIFLEYLIKFKFCELTSCEQIEISHIQQVTASDIMRFKAYLKEYESEYLSADGKKIKCIRRNSSFGINRKLSSVRGLFTYLYKTERLNENVTDKVDMNKLYQKIKKPLSSQEVMRLIDVLYNGENYFTGRALSEYKRKKQRDIAIFVTYLGTGIRVSELVNLNVSDICFETSSFIVTRKGGDQQEIFMPVQVENEICLYLKERLDNSSSDEKALFISRQGKRISVSSVEKMLKNYCRAIGIDDSDKSRPHALRRTFACRLLEDGVDIKMVAELMGHKNIDVTHRFYAQYNDAARKEIMRNLNIAEITN